MENSYTKYLEIIEEELEENIDKLSTIKSWLNQRIKIDKDFNYSRAVHSIVETIAHLKNVKQR